MNNRFMEHGTTGLTGWRRMNATALRMLVLLIWMIAPFGFRTACLAQQAGPAGTAPVMSDQHSPAVSDDKVSLTPQERQWLSRHDGLIRIGITVIPAQVLNVGEQYKGLCIDYIRFMEGKLGCDFELVPYATWNEVIQAAKARRIDMIFAAQQTPERLEYLLFTEPYIEMPNMILVRKDRQGVTDLKDMQGWRVATFRGSAVHKYLKREFPGLDLDLVPDELSGLMKVSVGEADAMVVEPSRASYYIEKAGITNLRVSGSADLLYRLRFAVRSDWPVLRGILDKGLAAITDEERRDINRRWIIVGERSVPASRASWIEFTVGMAVIALAVGGVVVWNWTLRRVVRQRTSQLQQELAERRLAEEALRESEEKYRRIVDTAGEGIWVLGPETKTTFVNARMTEILGYCAAEMTGRPLTDFMFAEDVPDHLGKMEARRKGLSENYERRLRRKDGGIVWIRAAATPILDEAGRFQGSFGMFTDITDRKKAENALLRLNRQLRAISTCNQVLLQASEERTLLEEICRIVCEAAGYRMAWVGYPQNDDARTVRPMAWAGGGEGYLKGARITWADTERGRGPTGRAIREGVSAFIHDFATDPHAAPWRESALQRGYRSSIALPLKEENGTPFGALCIYSDQPGTFTLEEMALLDELAGNLAFGIITLRIRAEHKKAEMQILSSEQLFRALVENSPDFIARYDREFRRIYVNPAIQKLFGGQTENVLGKTPSDQSPIYAPQIYIDRLRQVVATATESTAEMPFRTAQGEMHWGHMRFVPEFGPDGKVVSVLAIGRDIHEVKENEQRFRMLAENFPDFIVRFDRDGRYTYVNPAVEKAFGMPTEAIVGKTLQELPQHRKPEQNDALLEQIRRAFEEGVASESEALWDTAIGARIFEIRHAPEKDATGNVVSVLSIARDITARKQTEAELARHREHLEEIVKERTVELEEARNQARQYLDIAGVILVAIDTDRRVTLINQKGCELLESSSGEIIGKDWFETFVPENIRQDVIQGFRQLMAGELEPMEYFENPVLTQGGRERLIAWHNVLLRDGDGHITGTLSSGEDITERRRAEKQIINLNRDLQRRAVALQAANKELEAFAYSVSHDLRAPLRHIDGFLELFQKNAGTALDEQSRHYMGAISEAAQKMGRLIDDLLSFSRMGRHAMSFQPVDLGSLVHDIIRELEPDIAGRDITWRIGGLPSVRGDAAMLRIVLGNLISNALKFTQPRRQAQIEIGSKPGRDSEAVIFVRDNGVGFDMTYVDKLFGVFQRLHRAEEFEGTGIGLATVRRIISRHGGRTWAQGEPDQGATFFFSLP